MKFKFIMLAAVTGLLVFSLSGTAMAKKPKKVIKLGHIVAPEHPWNMGALKFKEEVEKSTDGDIRVDVYSSSQLGGDRDLVEGMQIGSVQMALVSGVLSNFEPKFSILEVGYLFKSKEHMRKVLNGQVGNMLLDSLKKKSGIRGLGWWERMPRMLTSNKPINSLKDVKGLKIRVPEIPAFIETWRSFGANPTPIAFAELYTALQLGTVDAQENPYDFIKSQRFYEVQKYLAVTEHLQNYVVLLISDRYFNGLDSKYQEAILKAADVATKYQNQLVADQEAVTKKFLEKHMTLTYPDQKEFRDAAKNAIKPFVKDPGAQEMIDQINAVWADMNK